MDPIRWKQIDELVDAALEIPEPERAEFIASKANGDAELERAVIELIAAQDSTNDFLQHSAMRIVAQAIASDGPGPKPTSYLNRTIDKYRIEKLLGSGGMGDVYLAFDERMKRNVALKILPAEYGSNDERVRRFEMEARAISSLNHPNIVTIFDVGNFEGINYIATEYVEGKTLRDLIGGRFKLRNVMANSIQICDALSAAHQAGIIHRDIKPENIMIRNDGYAKILDFGVAKLTEVGPETIKNFAKTSKGMIIGTPAYMSPAQVSGENVDHRTDIWSCGVVLYEFVTGKNPFKGANRQATFQAILSSDPAPCSSLNPDLPDDLDRILLKALEKDPGMGYQTASDMRADLKRIKRDLDSSPSWSGSGSGFASMRSRRPRRYWLAGAASLIVLLLITAATWAIFLRPSVEAQDWSGASNIQLTDRKGTEFYPSLSPDGRSFVFAADEEGQLDIFIQRVGGKNPINLTKDSKASDSEPAFSPDGEFIAFRSEREPKGIYVMGASGENLRRVADFGYMPSWSPDGKQVVLATFGLAAPSVRIRSNNSLWTVNIDTGERREILKEEASFPAWSPNGKRIAYWHYAKRSGRRDVSTIAADGSGEPVMVTPNFAVSNWNPVWSPDGRHLYFVSDKGGNLNFWRVAIDEGTGHVSGDPEPIVTPSKYSRHLNFSRDGKRMIYVQTDNQSNLKGVNLDPATRKVAGEPFWLTSGDREMVRAELSADGQRFVMRLTRRTQDDIAVVNRDGSNWVDVTNDAAFDRYPRWSPDGKQIAYASDRNEGYEIWVSNADGTNPRQVSFNYTHDNGSSFPTWSPDGTKLIYTNNARPYIVDLTKTWEEQKGPVLAVPPEFNTNFVTWDWSPDGSKLIGMIPLGERAIAMYSLTTGKFERLVENVDAIPSWLADSRTIVYASESRIFTLDTETRKPEEILPRSADRIGAAFISRDGLLLYYTVHVSESNIWLLDASAAK